MNLIVLSTAEESKTVRYNFTENSTFEYRVINLKDLDADEIITTVEEKIRKGLKIESEELIKYALVPMIKGKEMEKYITRIVENMSYSLMILSYGIEWLIIDKFITDEECRNILCDKLGDRMSLIYEYGNRREQKGMKKGMKIIIESLIRSGSSLNEISQKTGMTLTELKKILGSEKKEKVTAIPAK